jgi:hypothetical protein
MWGCGAARTDVVKCANSSHQYYFSKVAVLRLSSPSSPWLCSHPGRLDQNHPGSQGNRGRTSCNCHMSAVFRRTVAGQLHGQHTSMYPSSCEITIRPNGSRTKAETYLYSPALTHTAPAARLACVDHNGYTRCKKRSVRIEINKQTDLLDTLAPTLSQGAIESFSYKRG